MRKDKAIYLTEEQQESLHKIVRAGVHNAHVITRARVLLLLDRTGSYSSASPPQSKREVTQD